MESEKMLQQTRDAIDKMKNAGFKRNEFSARAERIGQEYGSTQISIRTAAKEKALLLVGEMRAQGLSVTLWLRKDHSCFYISAISNSKGALEKIIAR